MLVCIPSLDVLIVKQLFLGQDGVLFPIMLIMLVVLKR